MLKTALALLLVTGFSMAQTPVIFDTDIGPDYDDVGAMALLHAFADKGEIKILATVASNKSPYIAPTISVLNTYFRRPNLPIGVPKAPGGVTLTARQKWDSVLVARYPHAVKSNDAVPESVTIYRRVLASQPDGSVTVVTVGFLTNLANLLESGPDRYSKLSGTELVRKKVKQLVSMAGRFPGGKEFNVEKDAAASMIVFNQWPTPIVFSGFEIGMKVKSGIPLIQNASIQNSPVKDAFAIAIPQDKQDANGRMSWDQTAVLVAARGAEPWYRLEPGRFICNPDGSNGWDERGTGHFKLVEKAPVAEVEKVINELMQHQPK
jgi:inosine-uridine nucleoside N-ribohydrolase